MKPIKELSLAHIGDTIHITTDNLDVTGELAGIRYEHGDEVDFAREHTIGGVITSTLTFLPHHEINLDGYQAEFEVVG